MLTAMGARVDGIGTSTLEVEGVESLRPVRHDVVPDRIVAGTWAFAATMTRGDITVHGANAEHLEIALDKLMTAVAGVPSTGGGGLPGRLRRPADRRGRRDAAVPGLPDRPPADGAGHERRR